MTARPRKTAFREHKGRTAGSAFRAHQGRGSRAFSAHPARLRAVPVPKAITAAKVKKPKAPKLPKMKRATLNLALINTNR